MIQVAFSSGVKVIISRVIETVKRALFTSPVEDNKTPLMPVVIPRAEHCISRQDISENALKVLYRLNNAGFEAYLVGGCVRDLMMGIKPKDFDVVTNATPEQIQGVFRNCRLIGRRFRLAHIVFGREVIEVATFRGHHNEDATETAGQNDHGQLIRDNVFGTIEEDAERRDFTCNAMYYRVTDFTVTDFANGRSAIATKTLSLIGDPATRYREDPVRMLRAVRFAVKLHMRIDEAAATPIPSLSRLLANIPAARLFEECLKLFMSGNGEQTFLLLHQYGLVEPLFPVLAPLLQDENSKEFQFLLHVLRNTDARVNEQQRVTPAFFFAALLWYPVEEHAQKLQIEAGLLPNDAFTVAVGDILHRQTQRVMIPKRFTTVIRDIWMLQIRLPRRFGRRAFQTMAHPKFRAGYDFLLARGTVEGGALLELAHWWEQFQFASPASQKQLLDELKDKPAGNRRKRKRTTTKRNTHHVD